MAFTLITVTGKFTRADESPSQGTVVVQCSEALRNEAWLIERVPATGRLNDEGKLVGLDGQPFKLVATDDPGTLPVGATYEFTLEIDEGPVRAFSAVLPHLAAGHTIDISELEG